MKRKAFSVLFVALSSFFSTAYADVNCGYLNIMIMNHSGHTCQLSQYDLLSGAIALGRPAQEIPNNTLSLPFRVQQDWLRGPVVRLEYSCQNKSIVLVSSQNYCLLQAGNISGQVMASNNIHANFTARPGSYWQSLPGQIIWTLY